MWETLRNAWKVEELRKKLIYTFLMLVLFRMVGVIPVSGINAAVVKEVAGNYDMLGLVNMMTGNSFSQMTIMAMGITPYINSSIIMQLLTVAIPALERLQKDGGEEGKQKINRITRYVTVALAALQAIGIIAGLQKSGNVLRCAPAAGTGKGGGVIARQRAQQRRLHALRIAALQACGTLGTKAAGSRLAGGNHGHCHAGGTLAAFFTHHGAEASFLRCATLSSMLRRMRARIASFTLSGTGTASAAGLVAEIINCASESEITPRSASWLHRICASPAVMASPMRSLSR